MAFKPRETMKRSLVALLCAAAVLPCSAQSADQILDTMRDRYLLRMADVSDYTVVSDGFTSYHKRYIDAAGAAFFKTATEGPLGMVGNMTTTLHTDNLAALQERLTGRAAYAGRRELRGNQAHVLRVSDFSAFEGTEDAAPDSAVFHVHSETYVLMRVEMFGTDAGNGSITPTIDFEDYRVVDGMMYPFLTRITMVGAQADISQDQVEEARLAIDKLEDRLAAMPTAQREAMMAMIRPQIERMQGIVDTGTLETVFMVNDLRVNTGLSDALF
jgi:hypothetical protein